MLEPSLNNGVDEIPLDFAEFLSRRQGVETGKALSMLGSFLLAYEPLDGAARGPLARGQSSAAFHP
jgi:hypothetical protein